MSTPALQPVRMGLVLFDDVELLDHSGPFEVFTCAQRMALRQQQEGRPPACGFEVLSLARSEAAVRARAGQRLLPDATFDTAPELDVLIVPGGDVTHALKDEALVSWLAAQATRVRLLASVCTGVFLLGRAGVLPAGARVTTHWEDLDDLRRAHPELDVRADGRWMHHDGSPPIYTSAGISAGIDLSLHLVERLAGRTLAERTARQMDYRWVE